MTGILYGPNISETNPWIFPILIDTSNHAFWGNMYFPLEYAFDTCFAYAKAYGKMYTSLGKTGTKSFAIREVTTVRFDSSMFL